jgi:hypothetical protein
MTFLPPSASCKGFLSFPIFHSIPRSFQHWAQGQMRQKPTSLLSVLCVCVCVCVNGMCYCWDVCEGRV